MPSIFVEAADLDLREKPVLEAGNIAQPGLVGDHRAAGEAPQLAELAKPIAQVFGKGFGGKAVERAGVHIKADAVMALQRCINSGRRGVDIIAGDPAGNAKGDDVIGGCQRFEHADLPGGLMAGGCERDVGFHVAA